MNFEVRRELVDDFTHRFGEDEQAEDERQREHTVGYGSAGEALARSWRRLAAMLLDTKTNHSHFKKHWRIANKPPRDLAVAQGNWTDYPVGK